MSGWEPVAVPAVRGTSLFRERSHIFGNEKLPVSKSPREESKPMAGLTGRVARPAWFGLSAAQYPEVDSRKFAAGRHEDASWEGALEQRPAPVKKDGAKLRGQRHVGSNGGSARGSENHRQNTGNRG